jgi:hypothetical protein
LCAVLADSQSLGFKKASKMITASPLLYLTITYIIQNYFPEAFKLPLSWLPSPINKLVEDGNKAESIGYSFSIITFF